MSNHLRLGPWRELYQSGFPAKIAVVCLFRLSHVRYMASPSPPRFDHSNRQNVGSAIYEVSQYVVSSILMLLPHPEVQVTWSILLGTVFSKTLRLCSSLRARDEASNLYKTTGTNTGLCILSFTSSYVMLSHVIILQHLYVADFKSCVAVHSLYDGKWSYIC